MQYTTVRNQSIIDLAVQLYGNVDAIGELLRLNDLQNCFALSPDMDASEIDLAFSLKEGIVINYDENSILINRKALKDLNGVVIATGYIVRLFLLDFVTGAAAAWSLRRLYAVYNGPLVRLRKLSGLDAIEQDIGFTADGSFDTVGASAFLGADTGYVVKWYDQSGNGRNWEQSAEATQPTLLLNGVKGKPSISFVPAQRMGIPSSAGFFNFLHTNTATWTMLKIINQSPDNLKMIFDNCGGNSANYGVFSTSTVSGQYRLFVPNGASADMDITTNAGYLSGDTFLNVSYTGSNYVFRKNAAAFQTISGAALVSTPNNAAFSIQLGAGSSGGNANTFKLSELIFWPVDKTAYNSTIEGDVKANYGF